MSRNSVLIDVNLLLAVGWKSHTFHPEVKAWLDTGVKVSTCAITELGFLRVSMSPAFRADFASASSVCSAITSRYAFDFLPCDLSPLSMASVSRHQDTTDSYLVSLASSHELKLATLDDKLLSAEWGKGMAYNPIA